VKNKLWLKGGERETRKSPKPERKVKETNRRER
jgi:hypothetical protein